MKSFFKTMFASTLGTFLAGIILLFVGAAIFVGVVSSSVGKMGGDNEQATKTKAKSIFKLDLNKTIADYSPNRDLNFNFGPFTDEGAIGLESILKNIEKAKNDPNIEGIYLEANMPGGGLATLTEIREALVDFKSSGKWIVSYAEIMSQTGYYLSSISDELYLYPQGGMDIRGFGGSTMFYKGLMEKLGVEMQVIRGKNNKFKSAVEPFLLDKMSDANREQTEKYLGTLWNSVATRIAASNGISVERINELANNFEIKDAEAAVKLKLITEALYEDEVRDILKDKVSAKTFDDINFIGLKKYSKTKLEGKTPNFKAPKIAVIYAEGEIVDGNSSEGVSSGKFAKAIRDARLDDKVKAIVLRVNSPGGSALASDVIWRETVLAKEAKPLIVSMGNVAASGGYYISAAADRIFANENTITGSIGVFGLIPNAEKLATDKLALSFDGVKTHENADMGSMIKPLTELQYAAIQEGVEDIYNVFLTRVAEGRKLDKDFVDEIGQGRVWAGKDALELGLVDELGGLNAAIAYAAEQAEIADDYRLKSYPEKEDALKEFMKELTGEDVAIKMLEKQLSFSPQIKAQLKMIGSLNNIVKQPIQARIPYEIVIE